MTRRCPYCDEEIREHASKCKHCLSWLGPGPDPGVHVSGTGAPHWEVGPDKGLFSRTGMSRPRSDRMIGGVCAAIGRGIGIDPTWVRIAFALGTFFTAIAPGILVYIILLFVIPSEGDGDAWGT